jgi:hypothetical protein
MPKLATPHIHTQARNAKAHAESDCLCDGASMYLLLNTDGARYWRMANRLNGRRNPLPAGKYTEIPLLHARDQRLAASELIAS